MELYRKFIISIICLIFFYILFRLILQRFDIYQLNKFSQSASESFQTQTVNELQIANSTKMNLRTFNVNGITSVNGFTDPAKALQLRQYCIKAAFHPAFDGNYMSLDMLTYVLSRGCRFLVFEIYWASPTQLFSPIATTNPNFTNSECPVVAMSNHPSVPGSNKLALQDVLDMVNQTAFTNVCPNNGDPLFIQLCVKYDKNKITGPTMYDSVARIIENTVNNTYKGRVTSTTPIDKLMGKIVLLMDTRNDNSFYAADSPKLNNLIHMDFPSNSMQVYVYSDINGASNNNLKILPGNSEYVTNARQIDEVLPQSTDVAGNTKSVYMMTTNYSAMNMIFNQGIQITPMLFWKNDIYLTQYENMFNYGNGGIIPMSRALRYAQQNNTANVKSMRLP